MAELQRHKVGDLHYTDEEQRHILDLIIAERGQLQRNLDAAYAALRGCYEGGVHISGYVDADILTGKWEQDHAEALKKAKEAKDDAD
jgi:hypothetical protein